VAELKIRKWTKYGKARIYIAGIGAFGSDEYIDLETGQMTGGQVALDKLASASTSVEEIITQFS